ncbi:MAG: YceD family protein [Erysipelotrichaceae bacterium]
MIFLKWSKTELLRSKDSTIEFDDSISFEPATFAKVNHLRGLSDVTVSGNIHYDLSNDLVYVNLDIEGVMVVPCSITLEDVEYDFHTNSLEVFSFDKVDKDEDVHETKGDVVELLPVIFQLIIMEIPLKVVKPGLTEYPSGNGWEVVKEEDYLRSKQETKEIDPRLAKLKEFKIED